MNKKLIILRYFYLAILLLLCAWMGFVTATPSMATGEGQVVTPTLPYPSIADNYATARQDMMDIAERYWSYKWKAINNHPNDWWLNGGPSHTEIDPNDLHNDRHFEGVDTPDILWCQSPQGVAEGINPWGCWNYADAINIGIPYYWGGKTAIRNNPDFPDGEEELNLAPIDGRNIAGEEYFDQRL